MFGLGRRYFFFFEEMRRICIIRFYVWVVIFYFEFGLIGIKGEKSWKMLFRKDVCVVNVIYKRSYFLNLFFGVFYILWLEVGYLEFLVLGCVFMEDSYYLVIVLIGFDVLCELCRDIFFFLRLWLWEVLGSLV